VYATASDVPFLNPRWIERLVSRIGENDLAIASIAGRFHPLAALYRKSAVLPAIDGLLRENRLRTMLLPEHVKTSVLREEDLIDIDPELQTLRNLNHFDEYEAALDDAGLSRGVLNQEGGAGGP